MVGVIDALSRGDGLPRALCRCTIASAVDGEGPDAIVPVPVAVAELPKIHACHLLLACGPIWAVDHFGAVAIDEAILGPHLEGVAVGNQDRADLALADDSLPDCVVVDPCGLRLSRGGREASMRALAVAIDENSDCASLSRIVVAHLDNVQAVALAHLRAPAITSAAQLAVVFSVQAEVVRDTPAAPPAGRFVAEVAEVDILLAIPSVGVEVVAGICMVAAIVFVLIDTAAQVARVGIADGIIGVLGERGWDHECSELDEVFHCESCVLHIALSS